jgi:hypothetical protein
MPLEYQGQYEFIWRSLKRQSEKQAAQSNAKKNDKAITPESKPMVSDPQGKNDKDNRRNPA